MKMNFKTMAVATSMAVMMAGGASAATITVAGGGTEDNCSVSNMTTSVACVADFPTANPGGNVAGGDLDGLFFNDGLAISGWSEVDRLPDFDQGGGAGDQLSDGGDFSFTDAASGGLSGTWMLEGLTFDPEKFYVFALKGGTGQAAYFMDGIATSGFWTDDDLKGALSNVRLFHVDGGFDGGVIPLPAAGWMLLAGIGGLAALRRRKNS